MYPTYRKNGLGRTPLEAEDEDYDAVEALEVFGLKHSILLF
ncbi:MAG: hypothetical protein ACFCUV_21060 [Rivularia sp. (in: cyanobacteria)]